MKNLQKQLTEYLKTEKNNGHAHCTRNLRNKFVDIHPELERRDLILNTWKDKIDTGKFNLNQYIKSIILTDMQFSVNDYITGVQYSRGQREYGSFRPTFINDLETNEKISSNDLAVFPSLHMLRKAYDANKNLKWNGTRWILGDTNYQSKFNKIKSWVKRAKELNYEYTDENISIDLSRMDIPQTEQNINNCK